MEFIKIEEFKKIIEANPVHRTVAIWGIGKVGRQTYLSLAAHGIMVDCFVDGSNQSVVSTLYEKPVLRIHELSQIHITQLVIASYAYYPIAQKALELGVCQNIYGIIDILKYDFKEYMSDKELLSQYQREQGTHCSNRILVEIYGNIGDAILRLGIVKSFIHKYGRDCIYVLVETECIAQIFRLLTEQVIVLEESRYISDSEYRKNTLIYLNSKYFKETVILSDIRLIATRRMINESIFNTSTTIFDSQLPNLEYLLDLSINMVQKYYFMDQEVNLLPVGSINDELEMRSQTFRVQLSQQDSYVVVHGGATIMERMYRPEKLACVLEYLVGKGLKIAIIGEGKADERYIEQVLKLVNISEGIINYVSKLNILESLYLIKNSLLFVGTDSGMWNASYILGKTSVVLYGGGEYGCFRHKASNIHYVVHEQQECFGCRWFCDHKDLDGYSRCVGNIHTEYVIKAIEEALREITVTK